MKGKTIVITGASAGIGAALARLLAARGATLVLAARREAELGEIARATGATAVTGDMSKRADVLRLRDEAIRAHGQVDVWINNVGRGIARPILELTDEDVDEMIDVNVKSALYGMQAIVPHFQERGAGHLINVSSFLGKVPMAPIRSAYCAAKAALGSLTSILRMELARAYPDVHVSLIVPGIVATEFARNARNAPPQFTPPPGATSQSAEEVAAVIAEVIDAPVAERFTNPQQIGIWRGYAENPAAVEAMFTPRR